MMMRWKNTELMDPVREMERLQNEINRLFNVDSPDFGVGLFERTESPAVDVVETDDAFLVLCDLPGVELKDLDVQVANNVLTVKGEKKVVDEKHSAKVFRKETWEGAFQRTISMPAGIDPAKIDAKLTNGTLTITLPKREEVRPRQISVKVV